MTWNKYIDFEWQNGTKLRVFKYNGTKNIAIYNKGADKPFVIDQYTLDQIHETLTLVYNDHLVDHKKLEDAVRRVNDTSEEKK